MLLFEEDYYNHYELIAGCDEAGRGPLAGPLVVSAVILPKDFNHELINDSKKLNEKQREEAFKIIKENAIKLKIKVVDVNEIDNSNIYKVTKQAMLELCNEITNKPALFLTDAMPLEPMFIGNKECISIIKGDTKSKNIAAASIVAKVTRDNIMREIDEIYPEYGFSKHKGYGTKLHIEMIKKHGVIKGIHRLSYYPCKILDFRK